MSWIILSISLGTAITSIIHGVFMLFGSLSVSGGEIFGIPSTMLAALPIISAVFAIIGGVVAFNQSKWGALFLFIAGGFCVPSRDTWLYAGLYFLAGLLCFLLRSRPKDEYQDMIYENDDDYENDELEYKGEELENPIPVNNIDDVKTIVNSEPPQLRRRMSKICPECGATVSRENRFCPTCGAKLFVASELDEIQNIPSVNETLFDNPSAAPYSSDRADRSDQSAVVDQSAASYTSDRSAVVEEAENINLNSNDGDEMSIAQAVPNYRVMVRPNRETRQRANDPEEAASSYQEFSKYTRRAKKRKRSAGRKFLSILLLISAFGGALYFLLGLRKLPPGDLPPMVRPEVINVSEENNNNSRSTQQAKSINNDIAEPIEVAVSENLLPNFTPERTPKTGMVIGSNVNVRADHTTSSQRIARLSVNSKVEIIGNYNVTSGQYQGIWYNVITGGKEGWIYGRYVQPLGSGIPEGYSNALLKSFGSDKKQLIETLGQPSRASNTSAEWSGLTATLKDDNITRIRLTNSSRELQNGLKVGMSQTALLQIMGYPSGVSNRIMQYNEGSKTGLSVQLDKNNAISSITVNQIP